jgi:hypothetical protein
MGNKISSLMGKSDSLEKEINQLKKQISSSETEKKKQEELVELKIKELNDLILKKKELELLNEKNSKLLNEEKQKFKDLFLESEKKNKLLVELSKQVSFENGYISDKDLNELSSEKYDIKDIGFDESKINIGFIGRVSSGKSSLLKATLKTDDIDTGVGETTVIPKPYIYDSNKTLWDFPGFGGTKFNYSENKKYIYLLSIMDCVCFVYDGVLDTSCRQTYTFIKNMKNKKVKKNLK